MNEATDMEMIEVETSNASPTAAQDAAAGNHLALARQLVVQGNPSQALQAVVMAMKARGGEQAVLYILQRARDLYRSKLQASAEADELASLFAECMIAEAQPAISGQSSSPSPSPSPSPSSSSSLSVPATHTMADAHAIDSEAYAKSILAESGRKQTMLDAFSDGSSFICLQCGGLVSNYRKDNHYAYWCQF